MTTAAADLPMPRSEEVAVLVGVNFNHLQRLRNNKRRSRASELTRQEIGSMRGKLLRHFGLLLALRGKEGAKITCLKTDPNHGCFA